MDGSTSAFLYDAPFLSSPADDYLGGILYVEDFDSDLRTSERPVETLAPEMPAPLTQADLDAARAEGRMEGIESALADAAYSRTQLEAAALQSLAESFAGARISLERVATHHAAQSARVILAMMVAAVPATMARHGAIEINSMVECLLPGLLCEPELRVRTHPSLADLVREHLTENLSNGGMVLSVMADPRMGAGDVELCWQQGHARRDCQSVWDAIKTSLSFLSLPPTIEEVRHADGS